MDRFPAGTKTDPANMVNGSEKQSTYFFSLTRKKVMGKCEAWLVMQLTGLMKVLEKAFVECCRRIHTFYPLKAFNVGVKRLIHIFLLKHSKIPLLKEKYVGHKSSSSEKLLQGRNHQ